MKIVRADTGAVLFEGAGESVNSTAGTEAAVNLALNVAGKIFKSVKNSAKEIVAPGSGGSGDITAEIADMDLSQETAAAVRKVLDDFERRR